MDCFCFEIICQATSSMLLQAIVTAIISDFIIYYQRYYFCLEHYINSELQMYLDKNIEGMKIQKNNKSAAEILQIERASINHIRSISSELHSMLEQMSEMEPSFVSPTASPINRKYKSGPSVRTESQEDELMDMPFLKKKQQQTRNQQIKLQQQRKSLGSSVHYNTYMKPIKNIKQKIKVIIQEEQRQKSIEAEQKKKQIDEMKKNSNKNYTRIQPKYNKYGDNKAKKEQSIANRLMERQYQEMSGVTFMPKINKNIQIDEPFDKRLISNKHRQQRKEGQIIKQILKDQPHKPKINTHKESTSKIKQLWANSNKSMNQSYASERPSQNAWKTQNEKSPKANQIKTSVSQMQFMIQKMLFEG